MYKIKFGIQVKNNISLVLVAIFEEIYELNIV